MDSCIDGASTCLEYVVYFLGPLLILLALSIISMLAYSFFTILLPMLQEKYADSAWKNVILGLHCVWVLYLLACILFNYYSCVRAHHKGPLYDQVVRELAQATDVVYPESPAEVAQYKSDYEHKMLIRMRRRNAALNHGQQRSGSNGVTHRANATSSNNGNNQAPQAAPQQQQPKMRNWMLLGPLEWGYCGSSKQPKPPRSHYDHVTNALILNLDHYCPWMFNSIGYFNYRYFVSFLVYVFVGMTYGAIVTAEPFLLLQSSEYRTHYRYQRQHNEERPPQRAAPMVPFRDEKTLVTLSFMLCAAVGIAVLLLGGFHVYLCGTAQTTIEFHGNWTNRRRARKEGQKWSNPYSLGSFRANWEQTFGKQSSNWFWFLTSLLPSSKEPPFLPVPISNHPGRGKKAGEPIQSSELMV